MPSWWLNNVTAPDNAPTALSTLDNLPECDHININCLNSPIYFQLKTADPYIGHDKWGVWQPQIFFAPAQQPFYRQGLVGIRFWAVTPAAQLPAGTLQAQVTVEAVALYG